MRKHRLLATAAFGVESVVSKEVKRLGYGDIEVENGKIMYSGDDRAIAKSNIWLRSADRVYIVLSTFKALTFTELFDNIELIDWCGYLPVDANIIVNAKSVKSKLFSLRDIQSISKKSIVEKIKKRHKQEILPETGEKYSILISILKDKVEVLLDTSGSGLHKRGYRADANEAPIKETLAAAILSLSNWRGAIPLIDPMCGTGTFVIEAAMYARNIAPGLKREFAGEKFHFIDKNVWKEEREAALKAVDYSRSISLTGSDIDGFTIEIAKKNAQLAGVGDDCNFLVRDIKDLESEYETGYIVVNPPYGERMGEKEAVELLYSQMGNIFRKFKGFSKFVITSHEEFERYLGNRSDKNRKLYSGKIKCYMYSFDGVKPHKE